MFRLDTATNTITRLDLSATGSQLDKVRGLVFGGAGHLLSADGRWAAFTTADGTAVADDTNHVADVFVRGPAS